jgi:hypothetical protein
MDIQCEDGINSLEISNICVKCHKCGRVVPIAGKLTKPKNPSIQV